MAPGPPRGARRCLGRADGRPARRILVPPAHCPLNPLRRPEDRLRVCRHLPGSLPFESSGGGLGSASWPEQPIRAQAVGPQPIVTPPRSRQVVKSPRARPAESGGRSARGLRPQTPTRPPSNCGQALSGLAWAAASPLLLGHPLARPARPFQELQDPQLPPPLPGKSLDGPHPRPAPLFPGQGLRESPSPPPRLACEWDSRGSFSQAHPAPLPPTHCLPRA